jgi:thioredoxin-related protein
MKKLLFLSLILLWQFSNAQHAESQLNWLTDFEKAKVIAKNEHKPILMLFTGSDWCPPCKAMHNDLFPNKEFVELSKQVVLVMVDFPRRKPMSAEQRRKNGELQRKFHRGGVPTFVAVDADENILGKISGYRYGAPQRNIDFVKKMIQKIKSKK